MDTWISSLKLSDCLCDGFGLSYVTLYSIGFITGEGVERCLFEFDSKPFSLFLLFFLRFMEPLVIIILGGVLPFGSIFIEM